MIMGDFSGEVSEEGDNSIVEIEDDDDKLEVVSCFLLLFYFWIILMFILVGNIVLFFKYVYCWIFDKGEVNNLLVLIRIKIIENEKELYK